MNEHEIDPIRLIDQLTIELGVAHRQITAQRMVIEDLTQQLLDKTGTVELPGSAELAEVLDQDAGE